MYERRFLQHNNPILPSGKEFHEHLSYYSVRVLNDIIKETDAKVVISSSWRLIYSLEDIKYILNLYKFEGEVIDITPEILTTNRGGEIKAWIDGYSGDIKSYLALDDDCDMNKVLKGFLWIRRTKGYFGLSWYHLERAIKILNGKSKLNGIYNSFILIKPTISRFLFYKKIQFRNFIKGIDKYLKFREGLK